MNLLLLFIANLMENCLDFGQIIGQMFLIVSDMYSVLAANYVLDKSRELEEKVGGAERRGGKGSGSCGHLGEKMGPTPAPLNISIFKFCLYGYFYYVVFLCYHSNNNYYYHCF